MCLSYCTWEGEILSSNDIIIILVGAWPRDLFDPGEGETAWVSVVGQAIRQNEEPVSHIVYLVGAAHHVKMWC